MYRRMKAKVLVPSFLALCLSSGTLIADEVADFYKKTPISIYVASGPGGGFDAYARVLAVHLGRHIPGTPSIVIKNMPGATGLVAMNYLYNSAPRDGSAILASFNTAILSHLYGDASAKFDPRNMEWLGSIGKLTGTCLTWHTSPVKTIEDAKRQESLMGATGDGSTPVMFPRLLNAMAGTKFKVISGYSTPGMRLAVESGEVEGICGVAWETHMASVPSWILDKKVNFLTQLGLSESSHLKGVPLALDMIKNATDRDIYKLLAIPQEFGRPFLLPPKVDPERLLALQKAFSETLQDPAYRADAQRAGQFIDALTPAESRALVSQAYAAPSGILAKAAEYGGAGSGN
jgi:tripartite-type tricarboxylate transporter receptor subunit TctC